MQPKRDIALRAARAYGAGYSAAVIGLWAWMIAGTKLGDYLLRTYEPVDYLDVSTWLFWFVMALAAVVAGLVAGWRFFGRGEPFPWGRTLLVSVISVPLAVPLLMGAFVLAPVGFVWAPIAPWTKKGDRVAEKLAWCLFALGADALMVIAGLWMQETGGDMGGIIAVALTTAASSVYPACVVVLLAGTRLATPVAKTEDVPAAEPTAPAEQVTRVRPEVGVGLLCCAAGALTSFVFGPSTLNLGLLPFLIVALPALVAGWVYPLSIRTTLVALAAAVVGLPLGEMLHWLGYYIQGRTQYPSLSWFVHYGSWELMLVAIITLAFVLMGSYRRFAVRRAQA